MTSSRLVLRLGLSLVTLLALGALLAPWVAPAGPNAQDILARLHGPTATHWLGTDNFGRDVLTRVLFGLRTL